MRGGKITKHAGAKHGLGGNSFQKGGVVANKIKDIVSDQQSPLQQSQQLLVASRDQQYKGLLSNESIQISQLSPKRTSNGIIPLSITGQQQKIQVPFKENNNVFETTDINLDAQSINTDLHILVNNKQPLQHLQIGSSQGNQQHYGQQPFSSSVSKALLSNNQSMQILDQKYPNHHQYWQLENSCGDAGHLIDRSQSSLKAILHQTMSSVHQTSSSGPSLYNSEGDFHEDNMVVVQHARLDPRPVGQTPPKTQEQGTEADFMNFPSPKMTSIMEPMVDLQDKQSSESLSKQQLYNSRATISKFRNLDSSSPSPSHHESKDQATPYFVNKSSHLNFQHKVTSPKVISQGDMKYNDPRQSNRVAKKIKLFDPGLNQNPILIKQSSARVPGRSKLTVISHNNHVTNPNQNSKNDTNKLTYKLQNKKKNMASQASFEPFDIGQASLVDQKLQQDQSNFVSHVSIGTYAEAQVQSLLKTSGAYPMFIESQQNATMQQTFCFMGFAGVNSNQSNVVVQNDTQSQLRQQKEDEKQLQDELNILPEAVVQQKIEEEPQATIKFDYPEEDSKVIIIEHRQPMTKLQETLANKNPTKNSQKHQSSLPLSGTTESRQENVSLSEQKPLQNNIDVVDDQTEVPMIIPQQTEPQMQPTRRQASENEQNDSIITMDKDRSQKQNFESKLLMPGSAITLSKENEFGSKEQQFQEKEDSSNIQEQQVDLGLTMDQQDNMKEPIAVLSRTNTNYQIKVELLRTPSPVRSANKNRESPTAADTSLEIVGKTNLQNNINDLKFQTQRTGIKLTADMTFDNVKEDESKLLEQHNRQMTPEASQVSGVKTDKNIMEVIVSKEASTEIMTEEEQVVGRVQVDDQELISPLHKQNSSIDTGLLGNLKPNVTRKHEKQYLFQRIKAPIFKQKKYQGGQSPKRQILRLATVNLKEGADTLLDISDKQSSLIQRSPKIVRSPSPVIKEFPSLKGQLTSQSVVETEKTASNKDGKLQQLSQNIVKNSKGSQKQMNQTGGFNDEQPFFTSAYMLKHPGNMMLRTSLELKKDASEDTVSTEFNYLDPSGRRQILNNRASQQIIFSQEQEIGEPEQNYNLIQHMQNDQLVCLIVAENDDKEMAMQNAESQILIDSPLEHYEADAYDCQKEAQVLPKKETPKRTVSKLSINLGVNQDIIDSLPKLSVIQQEPDTALLMIRDRSDDKNPYEEACELIDSQNDSKNNILNTYIRNEDVKNQNTPQFTRKLVNTNNINQTSRAELIGNLMKRPTVEEIMQSNQFQENKNYIVEASDRLFPGKQHKSSKKILNETVQFRPQELKVFEPPQEQNEIVSPISPDRLVMAFRDNKYSTNIQTVKNGMLKLATSQSVKKSTTENKNQNQNRPPPITVTNSPIKRNQKNKQELNTVIETTIAVTASPNTDLEIINQTYNETIKGIKEHQHYDHQQISPQPQSNYIFYNNSRPADRLINQKRKFDEYQSKTSLALYGEANKGEHGGSSQLASNHDLLFHQKVMERMRRLHKDVSPTDGLKNHKQGAQNDNYNTFMAATPEELKAGLFGNNKSNGDVQQKNMAINEKGQIHSKQNSGFRYGVSQSLALNKQSLVADSTSSENSDINKIFPYQQSRGVFKSLISSSHYSPTGTPRKKTEKPIMSRNHRRDAQAASLMTKLNGSNKRVFQSVDLNKSRIYNNNNGSQNLMREEMRKLRKKKELQQRQMMSLQINKMPISLASKGINTVKQAKIKSKTNKNSSQLQITQSQLKLLIRTEPHTLNNNSVEVSSSDEEERQYMQEIGVISTTPQIMTSDKVLLPIVDERKRSLDKHYKKVLSKSKNTGFNQRQADNQQQQQQSNPLLLEIEERLKDPFTRTALLEKHDYTHHQRRWKKPSTNNLNQSINYTTRNTYNEARVQNKIPAMSFNRMDQNSRLLTISLLEEDKERRQTRNNRMISQQSLLPTLNPHLAGKIYNINHSNTIATEGDDGITLKNKNKKQRKVITVNAANPGHLGEQRHSSEYRAKAKVGGTGRASTQLAYIHPPFVAVHEMNKPHQQVQEKVNAKKPTVASFNNQVLRKATANRPQQAVATAVAATQDTEKYPPTLRQGKTSLISNSSSNMQHVGKV